MKIESSNIGFASQHASTSQTSIEESLRAWVGQQRPDFEGNRTDTGLLAAQTVATISAAGQQAAQASNEAQANAEMQDAANQAGNDPRMLLLISLVEALTGQKIKLFNPNDLKHGEAAQARPSQAEAAAQPNQRQGWGVEYDRHETLHESERTSFTAQGTIRTSDGKQIRFSLSLDMQREFTQESNVSIRKGDGVKKDPLVINFGGTAAQLTDQKFSFDLDSDGTAEKMSFVGAGSGFLALDKNGNGSIDNGSELFGTQSGNGFADLAAYDTNGNHWIDENDAIYSKLRVWSKDAAGKDTLGTLAQRNVGALYLGNVATPFDLKNAANALQGQVRSSGVYLHEDGSVRRSSIVRAEVAINGKERPLHFCHRRLDDALFGYLAQRVQSGQGLGPDARSCSLDPGSPLFLGSQGEPYPITSSGNPRQRRSVCRPLLEIYRRIFRMADVSDLNTQSARLTLMSRMYERGADEQQVGLVLGVADLSALRGRLPRRPPDLCLVMTQTD